MENGACALPIGFDDHIMALEGIKLMLNNGFKESEMLFNKFKQVSPQMSAGSSFLSFLNGLMTFEDEKLALAVSELKLTQKLCSMGDETFASIKTKFMKKANQKPQPTFATTLQNKIIAADCHLYLALISFIHQDISGYIKGGWILRKAWKIYEKLYEQINALYMLSQLTHNRNPATEQKGKVNPEQSKLQEQLKLIPPPTLERLHGSVSFGFGLFNLCVSLIPQKLLKVVNLIGFHGDRDIGLSSLKSASESEDMKSPLAMLALLWYHTVVRPFFAVDGERSDLGIPEVEQIMEKNEAIYPKSSFVLFFKGRIQRCKRNMEGALESFQFAYDSASDQRELQLLCGHEVGWCSLMQLDWQRAFTHFDMLRNESKWSVCYYTYLAALACGISGDILQSTKLFAEVPKTMKRKDNQLEQFIVRKAKTLQKVPVTYEYLLLYILELLYLWRALPNCTDDCLKKMLEECEKMTIKELAGLKNLVLGGIYKAMGVNDKAMQYFQIAMRISDRDFEDGHIAPYACFEISSLMMEVTHTKVKGYELLKQCKDSFEGYDFENRLHMRIHATEHRIKENNL